MKQKKTGRWKVIVAVIAAFILGLSVLVFLNLPKPLETLDSGYDLSQLADGTYSGSCDNGIVRVQVEVNIQSHTIADVRIVHHQNGLGSAAEAIVDDVVRYQSVELDAVTGATMSSQTILKAVENTLSKGTGE